MMKLSIVSMIALASTALAASVGYLAPLYVPPNADIVDHQYIVTLHEPSQQMSEVDVEQYVDEHLERLFASLNLEQAAEDLLIHKYMLGYAIELGGQMLHTLRIMPEVEYVEINSVVKASTVQRSPKNWGLDRISHDSLPLRQEYVYTSTGAGVTAYVIDTGINLNHVEFEGRAKWGATIMAGQPDTDNNGHGTHVSSTIAGKSYGVAKKATVVAVKVLNAAGAGYVSDVVKGVEWVATNHLARVKEAKNGSAKSVANMSLGGGKSRALARAVSNAVKQGVQFAVAAGNEDSDACGSSPADVAAVVTVGATTKYDVRSWFSNTGKCVDIFGPGSEITAAWIGSSTARATISGTSMATPHVCGVMALFLSQSDYTPAELKKAVEDAGISDVLEDVGSGSPNLMLYSAPNVKVPVEGELVLQA